MMMITFVNFTTRFALGLLTILITGNLSLRAQTTERQNHGRTDAGLPVLPGVSGFGQDAVGGKGGRVMVVSTLAPDGKGSLREAIDAEGPRIIVFAVAGVIDLNRKSLRINNPYVTIAGQTAPSPGITIIEGGLGITTHEVIIQHIRIRPGEAGQAKASGWEVDGMATGKGAYNVVIDHCSATWATDENLSASGPRFEGDNLGEWRRNTSHKVTISNCIIANGLSESTHSKIEHSKGTLVHDNATEILIYGNLYANNVDRHPLCKGGTQTVIVNNLVYNPGRAVIHYAMVPGQWRGHEMVGGIITAVGNYIEYGANTSSQIAAGIFQGGPVDVFWHDNTIVSAFPRNLFRGQANFLTEPALWPEGLVPLAAADVKAHVLDNAGAFYWDRDDIDRKIVEGVRNGTGRVINSEAEAGGYPVVKPVKRKFKSADWDLETLTRRRAGP